MKKNLTVAIAGLAVFLAAGCSGGQDQMSAADEKKMKDDFQHPPKLEDLPPGERERVAAMIDGFKRGSKKPPASVPAAAGK